MPEENFCEDSILGDDDDDYFAFIYYSVFCRKYFINFYPK